MFSQLRRWRERHFPDLQVMLRRDGHVSYLGLSGAQQTALLSLALFAGAAALGLGLYLGLRIHWLEADLAASGRAVAVAGAQRASVAQEMAETQRSLAESKHRAAASAVRDAESSAQLQARIATLAAELAERTRDAERYKSMLAERHAPASELDAERDGLVVLAAIGKAEAARKAALAGVRAPLKSRDADATPLPAGAKRRVAALLAARHVKVANLLDSVESAPEKAMGGPFVPLDGNMSPAQKELRERLLAKLIRTLPLGAPLDHYVVTSPFGARIDPFNHEPAFHPGVDLAAPMDTRVYSTAPGTVTFAGRDGGYGLLVDVGHGHGIVTMYSHLSHIYVEKGQHIPGHFPVGAEGSTGRSTGPHVFYEIKVDGTPVDPTRFLGAGGNVIRVGARQ